MELPKKIPVNQDAAATSTPLPANPAASGSQIPLVDTLTSEAMKLLAEYLVKHKDTLLSAGNNNSNYAHEFFSLDPPTFDGSSEDIEVAYDWIWDVEYIFELLNIPDGLKVTCATFKLKKHALNWWMSLKPAQKADGVTRISWQEFKDMFLDWYCTDTAKFEKEKEFLTLQQGNMSVFEYQNRFCRLSRFAEHHVDTDAKMAHRYVMGLRREIRGLVAVHCYKDFASATWAARTLEESVLVRTQPEHAPVRTQPGHANRTAGQKRKHRQIFRGQ